MADVAPPNEYEQARLRRIADNRQKLAALGLANGAAQLGAPASGLIAGWVAPSGDQAAPQPPRNQRRRAPVVSPEELAPTRVSKRKRGEAAELADEEAGEGGAARAAPRAPATPSATDDGAAAGPRARVPFPEPRPDITVLPPFTLRSVGVTVWELGAVQRDTFAPRFWSSKGCLFHHAYPVGYRAAKTHFGRAYTMRIVASRAGPRFQVTDDASGETFEGESPTKPWTAVCVSKRLGTRISGPLFFGFSDAVTMRALAALYTPAELAAARAGGGTVASRAPSAEERAAAEFRAVDGLGDATALALAHTGSLLPGGARLRSLTQLAAFARADEGAALTRFLLHSDEIAEATRRWPLWRIAFVPKIVAALLSDDPTAAKENRAAERAARQPAKRRGAQQLQAAPANEAPAAAPGQLTPPPAPVKPRPAKAPARVTAGACTPPAMEAPPACPAPPTITRSGRSARRKHDADWVWGGIC